MVDDDDSPNSVPPIPNSSAFFIFAPDNKLVSLFLVLFEKKKVDILEDYAIFLCFYDLKCRPTNLYLINV